MQMKQLGSNLAQYGGTALGLGMVTLGTVADFKQYRQQGNSPLVTALKTAGSFVFWDALDKWGPLYGLAQVSVAAGKASAQAYMMPPTQFYEKRGRFGAGYAPMTEAGYTMRQRSINAIRQNGLNLQEVFGNEARQYFERY